jgi:hypothetical protein
MISPLGILILLVTWPRCFAWSSHRRIQLVSLPSREVRARSVCLTIHPLGMNPRGHHLNLKRLHTNTHRSSALTIGVKKDVEDDDGPRKARGEIIHRTSLLLATCSGLAWMLISTKVLSFHPDPQFAQCTLQHNVFTMAQSWLFPIPVGWAATTAFHRSEARFTTAGIAMATAWLAASTACPALFCFGYDLIPTSLKLFGTLVFGSLSLLSLQQFGKTDSIQGSGSGSQVTANRPENLFMDSLPKWNASISSKLLCASAWGMLFFAVLPLLSAYPMATIPSILGKRLSRPASAFYLLATTMLLDLSKFSRRAEEQVVYLNTYQRLARGLQIGFGLHVLLVAMKLVGLDDGGFVIAGRGLWKWYPAMLKVPLALTASFGVHCVTA